VEARRAGRPALYYNAPVFIEAEAIPYGPTPLRGERLLVLAPHPDDEVIACGGLIALHAADHRNVRVVIATDGSGAGDPSVREEESRRGLARLGANIEVVFLGYTDRALGSDAADRLRGELLEFRPDLILVPSPVEIHPDHKALARLLIDLVHGDEAVFRELIASRIAFYEVSQPFRPNTLVDITAVAERKWAAIGEHASQLAVRDYSAFARGLNAYRTMTLPPECKAAEAYWVIDSPTLRTTPWSTLRTRMGTAIPEVEVVREVVPISVVVRTKDRPALLAEAVASIRANTIPCEIVVVNDGGAPVDAGIADVVIQHDQSRGRSEAANAGARAASNAFLAFLDDDDTFYPEHLATLSNATTNARAAWYTDAVSAFLKLGESGDYETHSRQQLYAQDFDRELLLIDNYIPLPTLLVQREPYLALGGFDSAFDLFEDWDFLIRLSQRGDFLRVPRVTCEVRHFEGGSSIVMASPEGSERFREAKLQVWKKHAALLTSDVHLNVHEQQKRRMLALSSEAVHAKGTAQSKDLEVFRLERDKQQVIAQNAEAMGLINGYALRVREMEGSIAAYSAMAGTAQAHALKLERHIDALTMQIESLTRENSGLRQANIETHQALQRTQVEVERVQGLLNLIFQSKTWKMHTLLEKLKGRG
jgi:LmbE family N-acetylglucosaminyl deacetylase